MRLIHQRAQTFLFSAWFRFSFALIFKICFRRRMSCPDAFLNQTMTYSKMN